MESDPVSAIHLQVGTICQRGKPGLGKGRLSEDADGCTCGDSDGQDATSPSLASPTCPWPPVRKVKTTSVTPVPAALHSQLQLPSLFRNLSGPVCWSFPFNTF